MARRKRSISRKPAAGVILLVGGLLLALSFLPKATGLPVLLGQWQRILLGAAAPVLPASAVAAGLYLIVAGESARFTRFAAALITLVLSGITAYHARIVPGSELAGRVGQGTGLIGGGLVWLFHTLLGEIGLWLAISLAVAAAVVLGSGRPLSDLLDFLKAAIGAAVQLIGRSLAFVWSRLVSGLSAARGWTQRLGLRLSEPAMRAAPFDSQQLAQGTRPGAAEGHERARSAGESSGSTGAREQGPEARNGERAAQQPVPPLPVIRETPQSDHRQESLKLEAPSGGYQLPQISLLTDLPGMRGKGKTDPVEVAKALEQTLASFGVEAKVVRWEQGPVVTRFEVQPAAGVRVHKISSLTNDIALALAAPSVRIEAPIPGKSAVGIELPNQKTSLVHIKEILSSEEYQRATTPLTVAIGKDIAGHPILADLAEMPHLLIAGATGSGKSVMLNAIIAGLLFRCTPLDVRLLMIDPKRVEFTNYNNVPHLLVPVVTNPRTTAAALKQMLAEMEARFERFAQAGVRNVQAYNQLTDVERLPYIVIIIDELADLMMVAPADFEDVIVRLCQMTRATGIHLVVATQRPSVDVITGLIKANIPSRVAFAVSSQVDSRTILDMPGAEKLLGKGDMLFMPIAAPRPVRAQGAFIADSEVQTLVTWWKSQGKPVYDQKIMHAEKSSAEGDGDEDALLAEAARLIVRSGYGSVSLLQRKMKIGYVRAARIVDQLEEKGIVGPTQGSNPREVLIGIEELDRLLAVKAKAE